MKNKNEIKIILATDCGSTTTKAILIEFKKGEYRLTYRGEAPTTVEAPFEDVTRGVLNSINYLQNHPQLRKVKCIIGDEEVELIAPPSIIEGEENKISKIPNIGENSINIRKEFNE